MGQLEGEKEGGKISLEGGKEDEYIKVKSVVEVYVCLCLCMYVCTYVYMYVCTYVYICMYVCM